MLKTNKSTKDSSLIRIIIFIVFILILNPIKLYAIDDEMKEEWNEWQKEDYWEWHTRTTATDAAYNGRHINIENGTINFYGYGITSYKDFLYKYYNNKGIKRFSFIIDETKANYHTLEGAGIIFNSSIKNNKLSGYVLLYKQSEICLYKLKDVDIDILETTANKTLQDYGELIKSTPKTNTTIHEFHIEVSPTEVNVKEGDEEILNYTIMDGESFGNDFGLISSYLEHNCSILSEIQFREFNLEINDEYYIVNTNDRNELLTDGKFVLKDENGNVIDSDIETNKGVIVLKSLKPGKYFIQQTESPNGYGINNNEYSFIITNDGKMNDGNTNQEIPYVNIVNEEIATSIGSAQEDKTVANKIIPNAGIKAIVIIIIISIIFIIIEYIINRKYKKI